MLKKLIIVYNPRASKSAEIEKEVFSVTRRLQGWLVGKYEVTEEGIERDIEELGKILQDGDLVVSVGGDGTALMTINAILASGKDATFSALGYGNLNDVATMLKTKRAVEYGDEYVGGITEITARFGLGRVKEIHPLMIEVDGQFYRYALCYFTMGLLAEASTIFEEKKVREHLQRKKSKTFYSLWRSFWWYMANHEQEFLPSGMMLNGEKAPEGTTDYLAVNSPRVASMMKSRKWYKSAEDFGSALVQAGKFWAMMGFGLRSVTKGLKLNKTNEDVIILDGNQDIMIQTEGEAEKLVGVKKILVRKSPKSLKVVMK